MPESITDVARVYILPSILGGVMVQLVATLKQPKSTAIAVGVSLLVVLLIVPNTPKIVSSFSIALCVILTVAVAWFTRSKDAEQDKAEEARIN
jgi:MFS superfamily sulfate permease-like transporter